MFWKLFALGFVVSYIWAVSAMYWMIAYYPDLHPDPEDWPRWYRDWIFDPEFDARMEAYERERNKSTH